MGDPIRWWRDDPDYFSVRDERRVVHLADIRRRRLLENQVAAAASDGSYSMVVRREQP